MKLFVVYLHYQAKNDLKMLHGKTGNTIYRLKVPSTTKRKLLKICHLRHRLRIFLFRRKVMFHSEDIQVFVFLATP